MWIPKLTSSVNRGQIIMTENAKEIPKCAQCPLREKSEKNPNSVPIEGEVGEKPQFSGEQDLALAYYMVPWVETVSGVSSPTRNVSISKKI
jgi:hypothetical protein